jgi:predicted PurR-regulated permease PerM
MKLPWSRTHSPATGATPPPVGGTGSNPDQAVVQLDDDQLAQLAAVFSAPRWLRDLGFATWLLVGIGVLLVGLMALLGLTSTIVDPVLAGLIVATVASPAVTWLHRRRVPRAAGAVLVLLALVALGVVILLLVVGGVKDQSGVIAEHASAAADKVEGWMEDVGVDSSGASAATNSVKQAVPNIISTLVHGVAGAIEGLTSLAFFLSFSVFSLFFLLKDGPSMRAWLDRHLGVPQPVAETITGGVINSVRRYFLGVTIVAAFNAVVVGLGALALGVPLAGTIAVVTLVTAYVPFIGAFVAGAFAVVIALGAEGTTTAVIMLVIVVLANGSLQNIVQPIAFGATLRINPLLVLVVTIAAGSLFGMIGMILAAPLTSAAIHISGGLAQARAAARRAIEQESAAGASEGSPAPG